MGKAIASRLTRYLMLRAGNDPRVLVYADLKVGAGKRIKVKRSRFKRGEHAGFVDPSTAKIDEVEVISIQRRQAIHVIASQRIGQLGVDCAQRPRGVVRLAGRVGGLRRARACTGQQRTKAVENDLHGCGGLVGGPPNELVSSGRRDTIAR